MSEERTAEVNGSRSFEERVFARFDSLEGRVMRLEAKQYDTRPIWEQALTAIDRMNTEMHAGFAELRAQIASCATKDEMHAGFQELRASCATKDEMQAGFAELRIELDFGLRRVARKVDALNNNILELHAGRYVDSRLEKVEAQLKPS